MSIFEDVETPETVEPAAGGEGPVDPSAADAGDKPRGRRRATLIALAIIAILLLLLGGILVWYLITHKPITTLPGISQDTPPHYARSIYGVTQPLGVAVNADGTRIYVTQSDTPRTTFLFDRDGKQIGTLKPPASTGTIHTPVYVAINPVTGDVYVTDRQTAQIYVYNAAGKFLRTMAHKGYKGAWVPLGVAFDSTGNLYVTQALAKTNSVSVFNPRGILERTIKTPSMMSFPNGIAISPKGLLAVTDSNNGRCFIFGTDGKVDWTIGTGSAPGDLGLPRGTTFDSQGHLVVVDTTDHNARVYSLANHGVVNYIGLFGDQGMGDGLFQYPNGAAADSRALVYVTDRVNNRVQVWSY